MAKLKADLAYLKEIDYKLLYRHKAVSVFGRYVKRGRDVTNEVADQLQAAEENGQISAEEFTQVLATDLLWGGQLRHEEGEIVLVIESSWLAEIGDVERAVARAAILRRIGLRALPVVAAQKWSKEATEAAPRQGAVMTTDGRVDETSWQSAITQVL